MILMKSFFILATVFERCLFKSFASLNTFEFVSFGTSIPFSVHTLIDGHIDT